MVYLIGLGAVSFVLLVWVVTSFNRLTSSKSLAEEAWSGIDVQLKRRYDLISNLVAVVKEYTIHEKNIINDIVTARAACMGAMKIDQKEKAEGALTASLTKLFALAEQYPNLKANENFLALQKDVSSVEDELQLARRYYNGAVRNYSIARVQFPSNIIAGIFKFEPLSYFEVMQTEERNSPHIKF
ncbi:LemA family protein [Candidatus Chromulinivorax destructor]|uniref:LemA family protein n=1 Tax=Candidatus Chromulinivorax destructor TaxID=2066483 RepID=A0A345ZBB0_9BACT|nr:LemA family protein [Candidatus Chromulinivorax destructor]AXK60577.1 hypothetical protein C0J27_02355 [Candidatus Chromulinivorax destructor]